MPLNLSIGTAQTWRYRVSSSPETASEFVGTSTHAPPLSCAGTAGVPDNKPSLETTWPCRGLPWKPLFAAPSWSQRHAWWLHSSIWDRVDRNLFRSTPSFYPQSDHRCGWFAIGWCRLPPTAGIGTGIMVRFRKALPAINERGTKNARNGHNQECQ
jgi:hypothetical protein